MIFSIEGKSVIVTGAANGVGLAIARYFVEHGAYVMMADIDKEKLKEEAELLKPYGGKTAFYAGDLREKLTHANLLSATIDVFDQVDVLINASRQVLLTDALDPQKDNFDLLMKQNIFASYRLSQLIAKRMIKQNQENKTQENGAIINLSSIASERAHPDLLAYSVSTAALNQMTRSLAVSLAPHGIRVNAIAIGSVMSQSLQDALKDDDKLRNFVIEATPLGYIADSIEVAGLAQFLSSDNARFITGQIINLDGGRSLIDPSAVAIH